MGATDYAAVYRDTDFRKHPEKYRVGKGEQGVLIAEPYKSEILPHWKFRTPEIATTSAKTIYRMFTAYKKAGDFVGMDMARKFLQMGFTRARRYANHASGKKYNPDGSVRPQDTGSEQTEKAEAARIFYTYYVRARDDEYYKECMTHHKTLEMKHA